MNLVNLRSKILIKFTFEIPFFPGNIIFLLYWKLQTYETSYRRKKLSLVLLRNKIMLSLLRTEMLGRTIS